MPIELDALLSRLIGGDDSAAAEILDRARYDDSPRLLVAAALVADEPQCYLARAGECAATTRDRQLVALAVAHVNDDAALLGALALDHLSDHPDSVLAAWIAAQHTLRGLPPTD
jgi:hypothetical protein